MKHSPKQSSELSRWCFLVGDMTQLTKKCVGNVLGHLVSGFARLGKMTQLFVQHSLEL